MVTKLWGIQAEICRTLKTSISGQQLGLYLTVFCCWNHIYRIISNCTVSSALPQLLRNQKSWPGVLRAFCLTPASWGGYPVLPYLLMTKLRRRNVNVAEDDTTNEWYSQFQPCVLTPKPALLLTCSQWLHLGIRTTCGSHSFADGASVYVGMLLPEQLVRGVLETSAIRAGFSQAHSAAALGGLSALLIHSEPHLGKSCFVNQFSLTFSFPPLSSRTLYFPGRREDEHHSWWVSLSLLLFKIPLLYSEILHGFFFVFNWSIAFLILSLFLTEV